mmetsp:Transcript_15732/g.33052  ORF Transcript_15732/g.33052 Transcript_15732/m.33052 type:complete len:609 (+) Transcript_15732:314-2140(+)|eukprot:CAMPEP_0171343034 /NCGR_PEP_ID=MMETSP0878-20121228/16085_1 /TAXON_ID=67004 /ORGANISM="Thalassiosira weissflogii, Strain CCMP1336" /LENGTH=608 /DNA_ID=CAMNT_0011845883 /DNA_START=230 /DNA_END=2056 /DNA_ORIENTATION=+
MSEESVASGMGRGTLLVVLGSLVILILVALRFVKSSSSSSKTGSSSAVGASALSSKSSAASSAAADTPLDPQADAAYLANCLRPTSTPLDVLYAIASTPDNLTMTQRSLSSAAELRSKKLAHLEKEKRQQSSAAHSNMEDLLAADEGWADDDEDDAAALAAKKAREEKEKRAEQLAKATGKAQNDVAKIKLEGVDEGVLGQEWVTARLTAMGAWPPPRLDGPASPLSRATSDPLVHPALKRNLLMTMGRLHARKLNTHPDLLAAGPKGLIDPTYFQSTLEYRQRASMLLEAALRMACTLRSYDLAVSVLDAMVMFKIGLLDVRDDAEKTWFADLMTQQYGPDNGPRLLLEDTHLGSPTPPEPKYDPKDDEGKTDEEKKDAARERDVIRRVAIAKAKQRPVLASDERMSLELQITRRHAEAFTKEKLAMCKKQGIPPQIGMQAYRESWFILVRARRVDGKEFSTEDPCYGNDHLQYFRKEAAKDSKKTEGGEEGSEGNSQQQQQQKSLISMLEPATESAFQTHFGSPGSTTMSDNRIVIGWPFVVSNVAQKSGRVKIQLPPPKDAGKYEFTVTIKSQDFLGVDEEVVLQVEVKEGEAKKEVETEDKKDK